MPKGIYKREDSFSKLERRFWKSYEIKENGCWEWTKLRSEGGYGRVTFLRTNGKTKNTAASRVSWELTHKVSLLPGILVCHKCDNPPCINPAHLFLGTAKDNSQDSVKKGRLHFGKNNGAYTHPEKMPRGEGNGNSKYKDAYLYEILVKYHLEKVPVLQLIKEHHIHRSYLFAIVKGYTRKDLFNKFICDNKLELNMEDKRRKK